MKYIGECDMNWTNENKPSMLTFNEPSEKALSSPENKVGWFNKYADYFEECPVGMSFKIEFDDVKHNSLASAVSRLNKTTNKKFKIIKHENCYEIYRRE